MKKIIVILSTILIFAAVNIFLYVTITRRTANNFSGVNQSKMIEVSEFLPFEEHSRLARTGSSMRFEGCDELPVLDGAAALVPVYASVIENCYPKGSVTYENGVFSDDNYYGENFASDSVMQYHNTVRGFDALIDGSTDLFFTAYPSKEQLLSARDKNVEIETVPIGSEAFVFFVNKNNPVDDLTSEQLRAIYRGEITNWKEVGGTSELINPLTRVKGSGSQSMMDKFMNNDMLTLREPLSVFGKSIGYSFRYYLSGMVADENVKMLSVDGIEPDRENIRNGKYPLTVNFYAVYRKDNQNPNVKKLIEWILSDEGQEMIEACGYVSLNN